MSIPLDPPAATTDIGILGEDFVASWLQAQGWTILHRRWRCRWGELDIVAQQRGKNDALTRGRSEVENEDGENQEEISPLSPLSPVASSLMLNDPCIVFVEVKTRSQRNWDGDGREAIATRKQGKLWMAATAFLAAYPELVEYPCRFDVACVGYQRLSRQLSSDAIANDIISDPAVQLAGYRLCLQDYIESAFEPSN